jgi:hypothetical protein
MWLVGWLVGRENKSWNDDDDKMENTDHWYYKTAFFHLFLSLVVVVMRSI